MLGAKNRKQVHIFKPAIGEVRMQGHAAQAGLGGPEPAPHLLILSLRIFHSPSQGLEAGDRALPSRVWGGHKGVEIIPT